MKMRTLKLKYQNWIKSSHKFGEHNFFDGFVIQGFVRTIAQIIFVIGMIILTSNSVEKFCELRPEHIGVNLKVDVL